MHNHRPCCSDEHDDGSPFAAYRCSKVRDDAARSRRYITSVDARYCKIIRTTTSLPTAASSLPTNNSFFLFYFFFHSLQLDSFDSVIQSLQSTFLLRQQELSLVTHHPPKLSKDGDGSVQRVQHRARCCNHDSFPRQYDAWSRSFSHHRPHLRR
jgi:hypothetical protein